MTATTAARRHSERISKARDRGAQRCREGRERGSVAAQTVVAIPLLVMLPMLIVQVAIWAFAAHTAQAAASQTLDETRVLTGTSSTGQAEGRQILDQLTSHTLHDVHIVVQRSARTVSVTITGTTETIVPGMHLSVHAHASGPVETFTPDPP